MRDLLLAGLVASSFTACASAASPVAASNTSEAPLPAAQECRFPDDAPVFTYRPELINVEAVSRALEAEFPRSRRDEGGVWTTVAWILVEGDGRPTEFEINRSSGDSRMDEAALEVARMMRFSPAENRGERVCSWVSIPITFRSRGSG